MISTRALAQAHALNHLFADQGMPVIFLKGTALAMTVYPQPNWRPMIDIDLLLPLDTNRLSPGGVTLQSPEAVATAVNLLRRQGYQRAYPELRVGHEQLTGHHMTLATGQPGYGQVELHWSIVDPHREWYCDHLDWFWEHVTWAEFEGSRYCVLNPAATLIHLSVHLALNHGLREVQLKWLLDLHLLIAQLEADLDWDQLIEGSRYLGWSSVVAEALTWTSALFGTVLPGDSLAALRTDDGRSWISAMQSRAVNKEPVVPTRSARSFAAVSQSYSDWRLRYTYFWRILVPDREYMRWRYPEYRYRPWPVAYFYRWRQIAVDVWGTVRAYLQTRLWQRHDSS
jgi:hypothetical protein